jgi:hypothetical protein
MGGCSIHADRSIVRPRRLAALLVLALTAILTCWLPSVAAASTESLSPVSGQAATPAVADTAQDPAATVSKVAGTAPRPVTGAGEAVRKRVQDATGSTLEQTAGAVRQTQVADGASSSPQARPATSPGTRTPAPHRADGNALSQRRTHDARRTRAGSEARRHGGHGGATGSQTSLLDRQQGVSSAPRATEPRASQPAFSGDDLPAPAPGGGVAGSAGTGAAGAALLMAALLAAGLALVPPRAGGRHRLRPASFGSALLVSALERPG